MNFLGVSLFAGIIGTGLGGLITVIFGKRTDKMISNILSMAGGVMTSIVFFELIPEAQLHSNTAFIILGLSIGVVMVLLLNSFIDKTSNAEHKVSQAHGSYEEFYHEGGMLTKPNPMMKSGILMFSVIGLHHLPEGLVIGVAYNHDATLSYTLALMIAIHNIPEGMALSAPLISGGMKKWKAIPVTLLAGIPSLIGALVGVAIGGISNVAIALSFSIAGGAMLYVVFGEILPQSMNMRKDRIPTIVLMVGIVIGYLLTRI